MHEITHILGMCSDSVQHYDLLDVLLISDTDIHLNLTRLRHFITSLILNIKYGI